MCSRWVSHPHLLRFMSEVFTITARRMCVLDRQSWAQQQHLVFTQPFTRNRQNGCFAFGRSKLATVNRKYVLLWYYFCVLCKQLTELLMHGFNLKLKWVRLCVDRSVSVKCAFQMRIFPHIVSDVSIQNLTQWHTVKLTLYHMWVLSSFVPRSKHSPSQL